MRGHGPVTPAPTPTYTTGSVGPDGDDTSAGWLMLPAYSVVRVSGTAARTFLARQLTCDVGALTSEHPICGAWLTPKGRAICLMHLLESADGSVLSLLPAALASDVLARLRLFVLREDVMLAPAPELCVAGLAGSATGVAAALGDQDREASAMAFGTHPSTMLLVGTKHAVNAFATKHACEPMTIDDWDRAQILAGLPVIVPATREAFIPQMLNLDRLGAVSFSKGCYPGQEIVARTQHLGRIKRRMFVARTGDAHVLAAPGDPVAVNGEMDAPGRVVLAASEGAGQVMLAVLPLDAVDAGATFRLASVHGPQLTISPPPYPLDDAPA